MHLVHVFPSFQMGGSQRRFAALANHFGGRYRHTIISLDKCEEAVALLHPQVDHREFPAPPKAKLAPTLLRAHRILSALSPDLLITYNWGAIEWAAANLACPVRHIHIEDGFGPEEANTQLRRRVLLRRLVLNLHSTLVLPSHTLVAMATKVWSIAPARIMYVPNGIPCARFSSKADPKTAGSFRGDGPIIGTVATLRKEKAIDRLIHTFREIGKSQPARLVIVGDGPERGALESLVAASDLTDSVTFTGNLSQPETVVGAFDVFAVSSDTEQMPLSVLEAMAAGLPIVSTDVGDIGVMVAEENRPFIVERTMPALARAMRHLLGDDTLRQRIGRANRDRATLEFDEGTMFAAYDRIFSGQP